MKYLGFFLLEVMDINISIKKIDYKPLKRVLILTMVFVILLCNSFIYPTKKAEAFAWAGIVPAGITIGAGTYVLGALAVGGIATAVGLEYGDDINRHAKNVWSGATDLAKDSINSTLDIMNATGEKVFKAGEGLQDWVSGKVGTIAGIGVTTLAKMNLDTAPTEGQSFTDQDASGNVITVNKSTAYEDALVQKSYSYNEASVSFPTDSSNIIYMNTSSGLFAYQKVEILYDFANLGNPGLNIQLYDQNTLYSEFALSGRMYPLRTLMKMRGVNTTATTIAFSELPVELNSAEKVEALMRDFNTTEEFFAFFQQVIGLDNIFVGKKELYEEYIAAKSRVTALDQLLNDGISLDLDNIKSYVPGTDIPLTMGLDGVLTYPDGTVFEGVPDYVLPNVAVIEIDGVLTYVSIDKDGVITNIQTGEIVGNVPGSPSDPGEEIPGEKKFNLKPLMMLGTTLKETFPFSIPFDVFGLFNKLNVNPITPKFSINSGDTINIGGKDIKVNYDFDIDFSIFDTIAKIIRWGLIFVFDISIILALRRLTPD